MPSIEEAFDCAEELVEDLPSTSLFYEEFAEDFWTYVRDRRCTAGEIVAVTIIWRLLFHDDGATAAIEELVRECAKPRRRHASKRH